MKDASDATGDWDDCEAHWDDDGASLGPCDWCGGPLDAGDPWDGLCDQCVYHANSGDGG